MTDDEIIIKIINKAIKNGYKLFDIESEIVNFELKQNLLFCDIKHKDGTNGFLSRNIYEIIFSYDFAKAFWGEEQKHFSKWGKCQKAWKGHIMIMVLEKKPIKYLEQFL